MVAPDQEHQHRAHATSLRGASARRCPAGEFLAHRHHIGPERVERRRVGLTSHTDCDIDRRPHSKRRQELDADELAEAPFEAIPIDGVFPVTRNDDTHTGMRERGSEHTDVEVHGPDSLPLLDGRLQIGPARQPIAAREAVSAVMRRRTWSEA